MRPKATNPDAVFQRLRGAAKISGLSEGYIRKGCQSGKIPHIRAGTDYLVNMDLWMQMLTAESTKGGGECV